MLDPTKKTVTTTQEREKKVEVIKKYAESMEFNEEEFLACLENEIKKGKKIGFGNNAEVIELPGAYSDYCVKAFKKYPKTKINDLETEVDFQKEVKNLGIRTPQVVYRVSYENKQYIVMERIHGISLGDALDIKGVGPFVEAKNFDFDVFFSKLEGMIKRLHEAKIYHRELHHGNVMLDYETGDPVIIDFGTATYGYGEDKDIYQATGRTLVDAENGVYQWATSMLFDDDNNVRVLKQQVRAHLHKHNFYNTN